MFLFLLSIEDVARIPQELRCIKASEEFTGDINYKTKTVSWWTRSAISGRNNTNGVHVVLPDGKICRCMSNTERFRQTGCCNVATHCDAEWVAVVPAMHLQSDIISALLRDKDEYILYGKTSSGDNYKWIDISKYIGTPTLLMAECLPEARCFDSTLNEYDKSDIKQFLENFKIWG